MKVIISGGGTGGHVYPAIAIANALKEEGVKDILFVGANGKLEMEKVPKAGYPIHGLDIKGFHRTRKWRNIFFPFRLMGSLWKAKKIIDKFGPDVVVGVGGYASGPVLKIAQLLKITTVIQEQNSYPGVTNKLLAAKAHKIFVAYKGMDKFFPIDKIVSTGNPVRKDLADIAGLRDEAVEHFNLDGSKKTILVFGGSLGAKSINEAVAAQIQVLECLQEVQVIWQVGKIYYDKYKEIELATKSHIKVMPFVDRMDLAYSVADVIVCRAGALTISELMIVGRPCILVPSPNVAEDHQTKNAEALVEEQAAQLVLDNVAKEEMIPRALELLNDNVTQNSLRNNIKAMAKPNARKEIAKAILELRNES